MDHSGQSEPEPAPSGSGTHICIVGSGPAGLALAHGLIGSGRRVTILESGGGGFDADDLSAAELSGDPLAAFNPVENRHRDVGGNGSKWVVKVTPDHAFGLRLGTFEALDFAHRPWVDGSGWPITADDLDPWYRRAHRLLGIGDDDYTAPAEPGDDRLLFPGLHRRRFRFGLSANLLDGVRSDIEAADGFRIVTDATVTNLETDGDRVTAARVVHHDGTVERFEADRFVVAVGGIETARLLLNSARDRGGLANEHDVVGRYYSDHPLYSTGDLVDIDDSVLRAASFFDFTVSEGQATHGYASVDAELAERHDLLGFGISIFPRAALRETRAVVAMQRTARRLKARSLDGGAGGDGSSGEGPVADLLDMAKGGPLLAKALATSARHGSSLLPGFGRGGWSQDPGRSRFRSLELMLQLEQTPDPTSRVTLDPIRVDRLGEPLTRVDWHLGDQTAHTVRWIRSRLAELHDGRGDALGRIDLRPSDPDELLTPASMAHHIGTARMGTDPRTSVVDGDLKAHGIANLWVAGSATFPTGGYANPTLTILALSLRLADHLRTRS